MRNCKKCGTAINPKYELCYDCHIEEQEMKEGKKDAKEGIVIDHKKKYNIPLWAIGAIFAIGITIGAWIW